MAGHAVTPATTPFGLAPALRSVAREGQRSRARASPRRASASAQATTSSSSPGLREAKRALLEACEGTFRGSAASASERAAVEEAQVALEGFTYKSNADPDLDLEALAGRWRLRWTNANDVLSVLRLARDSLGAVQVGDIFQTFDARGSLTNEIRLGLAFLTQSAARDTEGGLALKVGARYERVDAGASKGATTKNDDAKKKPSPPSRRTLALVFEEAKVTELRISDELELVFAPALLPRGAVNHRLLLALREAEARFDLSSAVAIGATPSSSVTKKKTGAPVGAYHVTYLDEDTLIGRANGAGGTFIFDRVA
jgi:hypothetical protein